MHSHQSDKYGSNESFEILGIPVTTLSKLLISERYFHSNILSYYTKNYSSSKTVLVFVTQNILVLDAINQFLIGNKIVHKQRLSISSTTICCFPLLILLYFDSHTRTIQVHLTLTVSILLITHSSFLVNQSALFVVPKSFPIHQLSIHRVNCLCVLFHSQYPAGKFLHNAPASKSKIQHWSHAYCPEQFIISFLFVN